MKTYDSSAFTVTFFKFLEYCFRSVENDNNYPVPKLTVYHYVDRQKVLMSIIPISFNTDSLFKFAINYNDDDDFTEFFDIRDLIGCIHSKVLTLGDNYNNFIHTPGKELVNKYPYLYTSFNNSYEDTTILFKSIIEYFNEALIEIDSYYNGSISFDPLDVVHYYRYNKILTKKSVIVYAGLMLRDSDYINYVLHKDEKDLDLFDSTILKIYKGEIDREVVLNQTALFCNIVENDYEDYEELIK